MSQERRKPNLSFCSSGFSMKQTEEPCSGQKLQVHRRYSEKP